MTRDTARTTFLSAYHHPAAMSDAVHGFPLDAPFSAVGEFNAVFVSRLPLFFRSGTAYE